MNVVYKNFSDMDSKPLTGCITHGNFTLVLKEIIFVVSFPTYYTLWKVIFYFYRDKEKINCAFSYTVTSTV